MSIILYLLLYQTIIDTTIEATETTTLKTFEITIPEKYVSAIHTLIKSLGRSIAVRKEKKYGLDEAYRHGTQLNV